MENNKALLEQLIEKLRLISLRQNETQHEINQLRRQIHQLQVNINAEDEMPTAPSVDPLIEEPALEEVPIAPVKSVTSTPVPPASEQLIKRTRRPVKPTPKRKPVFPPINMDFEKFIGENLISKVAILILLLGAAIGGKYAINNSLISPLTRIILGYLLGTGLIGTALRLKHKYEGFSAVLLSGGVTILYFMTFFAYAFYDLIPQTIAFGLMAIFTVFTVVAALHYNRQIIAHLGLVGSYAIPFLLSNDTGNFLFLFCYMALVNAGVLAISVRKYWKLLYYMAFFATTVIFGFWMMDFSYQADNFKLGFGFATIFFVIFYATFLGYKIINREEFKRGDVAMVLLNAFAFYGFGYILLAQRPEYVNLVGLFTLLNAVIHFGVSGMVYKFRLADRNLFYLISGLVLVFLTIAIPVQLDGNWVILAWLAEAVLLFWVARRQGVAFYERMSYVGMVLAIIGLWVNWVARADRFYQTELVNFVPVFNANFLLNLLYIIGFSAITYILFSKKYPPSAELRPGLQKFLRYAIPLVTILLLYTAFLFEINEYWNTNYENSRLLAKTSGTNEYVSGNKSMQLFQVVSALCYTMLFLIAIGAINLWRFKSKNIAIVTLFMMGLTSFFFVTGGELVLLELWNNYLERDQEPNFERGIMHLLSRYLSLGIFSGLLIMIDRTIKRFFPDHLMNTVFQVAFHISILVILSFELTGWMDMNGALQPHRFGLSILWGIYALALIGLGIHKKNKYLRYLAFAIFGLTLLKLFAYDLAGLDTIGKAVVLVSLGILLLLVSFLYNKYNDTIYDEK